ncbi:hypothetical protein RND71_017632 [Anisodus tanguticus]|uniref:Calmodulin-binding protein 60 A-like n=1 Tax=Anisodus tanguticus TaxID=243964 RepID=A0AAE1S4I3_9SOLA|nr:hypothetical protein RND71_017632 [Anisodus tanguticus]
MLEVMVIQTFNRCLMPTLETSIRNVVKHELELVEKMFLFAKGNPEKDIQAPKPRSLKLKFLTKVSVPVLTGVEIKGEGGNSIEVALVDDNTGAIVDSGPEASAKVEIVVLRGEFGDDDGGNWTAEEFCSNVVREREGKKSLLAETGHVRLNKGIGFIDKIRFTHSSIYMRRGMFRLGARIVDSFNSIQVKEARTESFTVKDGRQLYKDKHDPPSLSDGVHRLKNIGRGSKYRLEVENVNTVEDFLIMLLKDRERLKCANAQRLLVSACEHWNHVVPVDNETSLVQYLSQILLAKNPSNSPNRELPSTSNGFENFSNLEFSNSPIYSPSIQDWIDQCNYRLEDLVFGFDAHQPHDASASKLIGYISELLITDKESIPSPADSSYSFWCSSSWDMMFLELL